MQKNDLFISSFINFDKKTFTDLAEDEEIFNSDYDFLDILIKSIEKNKNDYNAITKFYFELIDEEVCLKFNTSNFFKIKDPYYIKILLTFDINEYLDENGDDYSSMFFKKFDFNAIKILYDNNYCFENKKNFDTIFSKEYINKSKKITNFFIKNKHEYLNVDNRENLLKNILNKEVFKNPFGNVDYDYLNDVLKIFKINKEKYIKIIEIYTKDLNIGHQTIEYDLIKDSYFYLFEY